VGPVGSAAHSASSTGATITVGPAGVKAGDAVLLSVLLTNVDPDFPAVTDSAGNSYVIQHNISDGSAGDSVFTAASLKTAGLAPGATIWVTYAAADQAYLRADEFRGLSSADRGAQAFATSALFTSGPTAATSHPAELLYATLGAESGGPPSWTAGWTVLPALMNGSDALGAAYQVVAATGSYAASGTVSGGTWMAALTTYS